MSRHSDAANSCDNAEPQTSKGNTMKESGFRRITIAGSAVCGIVAAVCFALRLNEHFDYVEKYRRSHSPRDISGLLSHQSSYMAPPMSLWSLIPPWLLIIIAA